jgi:hypothetical protein
VEVEPDWSVSNTSPYAAKPTKNYGYGTRWLVNHLRQVTGRQLGRQIVGKMLRDLYSDTKTGHQWKFDGPDDPRVKGLIQYIELGYYDIARRESVSKAREAWARKQARDAELAAATHKSNEYRERRAREIKEAIENDEPS